MKKSILISALLCASVVFAKSPAAPVLTKTDVTGAIKWTGYGVGKSHTGTLDVKSGFVEMKGDQLVGGEFTIDMTSLKTSDSEKLQGHLQSPDFFDVKNNPEGKFKITKVDGSKITGDLTIKGKTNPETFTAAITKGGKKWIAHAETEIQDRTKYDIKYNSAQFKTASALGDKLIEDKIKIEMDLTTK